MTTAGLRIRRPGGAQSETGAVLARLDGATLLRGLLALVIRPSRVTSRDQILCADQLSVVSSARNHPKLVWVSNRRATGARERTGREDAARRGTTLAPMAKGTREPGRRGLTLRGHNHRVGSRLWPRGSFRQMGLANQNRAAPMRLRRKAATRARQTGRSVTSPSLPARRSIAERLLSPRAAFVFGDR
jgi:hypothetical protein